MGADIAKILAEVKLPERRDAGVTGEEAPKKEVQNIDALLGARDTPIPAPPVSAERATSGRMENNAGEKHSVESVHTLKHDLQHVVQDQKISVVRAVALEEDRRIARTAVPEPIQDVRAAQQRKNRVKNIVFGAILLIALGGAALGGVYVVMNDRAAVVPVQSSDSLVFAEQTVTLALDDQSPTQLKSTLERARGTASASLGSITRIVPVHTTSDAQQVPVTLAEFFAALGIKPPEQLSRALGDKFFFGLHTIDKNAPVLVIEVASYDNAFAGMLAWEDQLNANLAPAYIAVPRLVIGPDGIPTKRTFVDDVMRNYDVRQLKDDAGAIALYYSFPTRGLLVIAESPYTFTELLNRLQAQNRL